MNKMPNKTRRNIILQLLLLAALIGVTFWWLLRDCDVETMLSTLKGANLWLIGLGLLCMGLYIFCGGSSAAVFLGGLPFFPDFPLAVALCRVPVASEQRLALREIGFFGLAALPAVQ